MSIYIYANAIHIWVSYNPINRQAGDMSLWWSRYQQYCHHQYICQSAPGSPCGHSLIFYVQWNTSCEQYKSMVVKRCANKLENRSIGIHYGRFVKCDSSRISGYCIQSILVNDWLYINLHSRSHMAIPLVPRAITTHHARSINFPYAKHVHNFESH